MNWFLGIGRDYYYFMFQAGNIAIRMRPRGRAKPDIRLSDVMAGTLETSLNEEETESDSSSSTSSSETYRYRLSNYSLGQESLLKGFWFCNFVSQLLKTIGWQISLTHYVSLICTVRSFKHLFILFSLYFFIRESFMSWTIEFSFFYYWQSWAFAHLHATKPQFLGTELSTLFCDFRCAS